MLNIDCDKEIILNFSIESIIKKKIYCQFSNIKINGLKDNNNISVSYILNII